MEKDSLGLIETLGMVAAVEAADAGIESCQCPLPRLWKRTGRFDHGDVYRRCGCGSSGG